MRRMLYAVIAASPLIFYAACSRYDRTSASPTETTNINSPTALSQGVLAPGAPTTNALNAVTGLTGAPLSAGGAATAGGTPDRAAHSSISNLAAGTPGTTGSPMPGGTGAARGGAVGTIGNAFSRPPGTAASGRAGE